MASDHDGVDATDRPDEAQSEGPSERPTMGAGFVDLPVPGAVIRSPNADVAGWLLPESGYDRVEVQLDCGPTYRARIMSSPRPDVAACSSEPGAPLAGWELLLEVPDVDRVTQAQLRVEAVGPSGRLELALTPVEVHPRVARRVSEPARLAVLSARVAMATNRARSMDASHVLVATHDLGLGGGQLYLQELLRHLLKREDMSCTVLSMVDGALRSELEEWGARVHIVGPIPIEGLAYEARMLELASLVALDGVRCVIANTGGAFWGVDLADRLGVPAIWAIHESFAIDQLMAVGFGDPDDHIRERYLAAVRSAAALVFEADATSRLYEATARPGRCTRVDYGIDLDHISRVRSRRDRASVRASLGVPLDSTLLLCMGTFEPRKAQGALAVAFGRLASKHPDAILALVGDRPTLYAAGVHAVLDRLQLGARIRVEPVTPNIDDWYLVADGFVLGSDVESLPRSMLEVMAFGVPVMGSAVFGIPELITDGETGLLFEPSCLGAITAVLDRFLCMPSEERRAIGEAGRRLVESTRASHFYGEAYSALLDAFLEDPEADPATVLGHR